MSIHFRRYIITFLVGCFLLFNQEIKGYPIDSIKSGGPDTLAALVTYGDDWLTRQAFHLETIDLALLMDSLYSLEKAPVDVLERLALLYHMRFKSTEELDLILDSLFTLDEIPYALINEINLIKGSEEMVLSINRPLYSISENEIYPAHSLYGSWNTKKANPYGHVLFYKDTSHTELCLNDVYWNCGNAIPYDGKITSRYGWRNGKNHNGIDIDLEVWDTVKTAFPGMVRFAGLAGGYGRLIIIRHYNGLETYYAHLHRYKVKTGQIVDAGELIGLGGSSGNSSGSHLHFEIRFKGIPINPEHVFSFSDQELVADTLIFNKNKYGYYAFPKGATFYTIKPGDYLYKIASHYGMTVSQLCAINGINRNSVLRVGQKLRIKT